MRGDLEYRGRRRAGLADKVNLAMALIFLAIFLAAAIYSASDSDFRGAAGATMLPWAESRPAGTILVVERDNTEKLVAKTALERMGYSVALVDDPPQALSILRAAPRSVELLLFGDANPAAAERAIREFHRARPDLPILASSSTRTVSGASAQIVSPFEARSLAAAVQALLPRR